MQLIQVLRPLHCRLLLTQLEAGPRDEGSQLGDAGHVGCNDCEHVWPLWERDRGGVLEAGGVRDLCRLLPDEDVLVLAGHRTDQRREHVEGLRVRHNHALHRYLSNMHGHRLQHGGEGAKQGAAYDH